MPERMVGEEVEMRLLKSISKNILPCISATTMITKYVELCGDLKRLPTAKKGRSKERKRYVGYLRACVLIEFSNIVHKASIVGSNSV